jgi:hypothetical protein
MLQVLLYCLLKRDAKTSDALSIRDVHHLLEVKTSLLNARFLHFDLIKIYTQFAQTREDNVMAMRAPTAN